MPYIFGLLVLANAGLLGYFVLLDSKDSKAEPAVMEAKSQLSKEISFKNTSDNVPPLVGNEK